MDTQQSGKTFLTQFESVCDRLSDTAYKFQFRCGSGIDAMTAVTWQDAIIFLQQNKTFRSLLTNTLANVPFPAFFWETPPITPINLEQSWECVVVAAPALSEVEPDPEPFREYLIRAGSKTAIATFPNLGSDALLIVPREQGNISAYTHMANFLRLAPKSQIHQLWQVLGQAIQRHWAHRQGRSLWVSTSGLGVYWLHIRLDDAPKYYTYEPYKRTSSNE